VINKLILSTNFTNTCTFSFTFWITNLAASCSTTDAIFYKYLRYWNSLFIALKTETKTTVNMRLMLNTNYFKTGSAFIFFWLIPWPIIRQESLWLAFRTYDMILFRFLFVAFEKFLDESWRYKWDINLRKYDTLEADVRVVPKKSIELRITFIAYWTFYLIRKQHCVLFYTRSDIWSTWASCCIILNIRLIFFNRVCLILLFCLLIYLRTDSLLVRIFLWFRILGRLAFNIKYRQELISWYLLLRCHNYLWAFD